MEETYSESKLGVDKTETSEEVATIAETELKDTTPILGHHEIQSHRNNVIGGILAYYSQPAVSSFSS